LIVAASPALQAALHSAGVVCSPLGFDDPAEMLADSYRAAALAGKARRGLLAAANL